METTTSADGTTIAFDRLGDGPPLVLVPGATCTRGVTRPLAEALAGHLQVLNVDRRGRGDSDDCATRPPYDPTREVEDLAAVIEAAGGRASLYGHSSGAAVVLRAAAAGLPVDRLVLHDAPYDAGGTGDRPRRWHTELHELLAAGRPGDAVAAFMGMVGMPEPLVADLRRSPGWAAMEAVGPTLAYDSAAMGDADGGRVPRDLLRAVTAPTLVLVGGADHGFMIDVARAMVAELDDGRLEHLVGAGHDAGPDVVAPGLLTFLAP